MKCWNCQTVNPEEAKFCFNCGVQLRRACQNCGAELSPTAKFCHNCGQPVQGAAPATTPSTPAAEPASAAPGPGASREATTPDRRMPTELAG